MHSVFWVYNWSINVVKSISIRDQNLWLSNTWDCSLLHVCRQRADRHALLMWAAGRTAARSSVDSIALYIYISTASNATGIPSLRLWNDCPWRSSNPSVGYDCRATGRVLCSHPFFTKSAVCIERIQMHSTWTNKLSISFFIRGKSSDGRHVALIEMCIFGLNWFCEFSFRCGGDRSTIAGTKFIEEIVKSTGIGRSTRQQHS